MAYNDDDDLWLSPYERAVKRGGQQAGDDLLKASDEYYTNYAQGPGDPNPGLPKPGGDASRAAVNWNDPQSFSWLTNTDTKDAPAPANGGTTQGGGGGSSSRDEALQQVSQTYNSYQPQNNNSALNDTIAQMIAGLQADRERQAQERAAMRELLMGHIGQASKPVTMNDPGIAEILSAQRGAGQRSAERRRLELTEGLSADGQVFRGAFNPRNDRIEQERAESEQQFIGEIMNRELSGRRQQLQSLLAMAVSMGDAESARALQAQLALIEGQLQEGRFGQQIGFDRYRFDNDLGARLLQLELLGNQNAVNSYL